MLAGVFKFQSLDGTLYPGPLQKYNTDVVNFLNISVCLRRAGEIIPDKTPTEEIHENKFSHLMKNKNVHLLAVFLTVYTGIEATIGGKIRSLR